MNPRCPKCNSILRFRKRPNGYVCKNWQCKNYWKMGYGAVFNMVNGKLVKRIDAGYPHKGDS